MTWTKTASDSSTSSSDNALNAVIYGSNIFVAVGYTKGSGMILTSPDGVTWTQRTSDSPAWFNAVGYGNNTFVVVGDKGTILTSYDGVTWTNRTSGVSDYLDRALSKFVLRPLRQSGVRRLLGESAPVRT
nr:hypothetical protein [Candidatus Magnetobacterium casensis]